MNLAGIEKTALARGDWLADPQALVPTTRIDVKFRLLANGTRVANGARLHIHMGTAHRVARVVFLEGNDVNAAASLRVQLVFGAPICVPAATSHCAGCAGPAHHRRRRGDRRLRAGAPAAQS